MSDVVSGSAVKNTWVLRVLKVDVAAPGHDPKVQGVPPEEGQPGPGPLDAGEVRGRLNELGLLLRNLGQTPEKARLATRFADAVTALKASDLAGASAVLDELEGQIRGSQSVARANEIKGQDGEENVSLVAIARASLAWREACAHARSEIEALRGDVITALIEEDEHDAAELDEIEDSLGGLDSIFDVVQPKLSDMIDAAINQTQDKRAAMLRGVLAQIPKAEADILADSMIAAAQDNGRRKVDISGPALAALKMLRSELEHLTAA
jgi:hypothetical protein